MIQNFEIWGEYCENIHTKNDIVNEFKYVTTIKSNNVVMDDFDFNYIGNQTSITLQNYSIGEATYNRITKGKAMPEHTIQVTSTYDGKPYNLIIGNDIFGITDKNNEFDFLTDDEYRITQIDIDDFSNLNGTIYEKGKYDIELYVRHKNSNIYELYKNFKNGKLSRINFENDSNIVGFYFKIKNLKESFCFEKYDYIRVYNEVFRPKNVNENGSIYSFGYIENYEINEDGTETLRNEVDLDSYATELTKKIIAPYDQKNYNKYHQRSFSTRNYKNEDVFSMYLKADSKNIKEDPIKEIVTFQNTVTNNLIISEFGYVDYWYGYKIYNLLPEGINLSASKKDIIDSLIIKPNFNCNLLSVNGKTFKSEIEFSDFIKEHTEVNIMENYNNSNRTKIEILFNFKDEPIYIANILNLFMPRLQISTTLDLNVTYDALEEYGVSYDNYFYAEIYNSSTPNYYFKPHSFGKIVKDNGSLDKAASDINNNGITTEDLCANIATTSINHVVASHQDVTLQAKSDINNFDTGNINASYGGEYNYKLRVRTGQNSITNLIIYNNLETSFGTKKYWQGNFEGIDTSYATGKGYIVKSYYSVNDKAGNLLEDSSWKEYIEGSTDKTKVKSLAFKILDKNGNPAIIPNSSMVYILVNMKSPSDEKIKTLAYNQIRTQWNAIDVNGNIVDFITGIDSNIVKVSLPNSAKDSGFANIVATKKFINSKNENASEDDFKSIGMNPNEQHNYKITLTNEDTLESFSGILNDKKNLIINSIAAGKYKIEELNNNKTILSNIELVTESDDIELKIENNNYYLIINEDIPSNTNIEIIFVNKLKEKQYYQDEDEKINLFK